MSSKIYIVGMGPGTGEMMTTGRSCIVRQRCDRRISGVFKIIRR